MASVGACHPAASCSAFGNFVMKLPASCSVTSRRSRGNGIGSSNSRDHDTGSTARVTFVTLSVIVHHSVVNYTYLGNGNRMRWLGVDLLVLFDDNVADISQRRMDHVSWV
jgi:hypothetical protein